MENNTSDRQAVFVLHQCNSWHSVQDIQVLLEHIIAQADLIPLDKNPVQVAHRRSAFPVAQDLLTLVAKSYYTNEPWEPSFLERCVPQQVIRLRLRTTFSPEWRVLEPYYGAVELMFVAERYGKLYTNVSLYCFLRGLSGIIDRGPMSIQWHHHVLDLYRSIADIAVQMLQPDYALITDAKYHCDENIHVLNQQLNYIHWWNYYGPTFLRVYGMDTFLQAPGWQKTQLYTGLKYQLTERFVDSKNPELQQQVRKYFHPWRVKDVA